MENKVPLNSEYFHSRKTNSYRRRSKSLSDNVDNGKNSSLYSRRHHSPPPRRAHHQPIMKFNADMWMQVQFLYFHIMFHNFLLIISSCFS